MDTFASINIAIEFVAVLLALSTLIGTFALSKKKTKEKLPLASIILLLGLSALANALYFLFMGREGEDVKTLNFILKFVRIGVGFWLVAGINDFILSLFGEPKSWYKIYKIGVYSLMGFMTILLVINVFTHFIYYVDDKNVYQRSDAFFLIHLVEGLVWTADAVLFFLNRKTLSKQVKRTFYISLFFLVVTTALQFVFSQIAFYDIMIVMNIVFLMFGEQVQMREQLAERDKQLLRQQEEMMTLRQNTLIKQIQPHFIYNSLFSIRNIDGNPEETRRAITEFANYIRGNLAALDGKEMIPFETEIEYVKDYVSLQQRRFPGKIDVKYDVTDADFSVPPLTVQILVENAIKHGISVRYESGKISVSSRREGDFHVITVEDDGVGFDTEKLKNTDRVGLRAVTTRLEYFVRGTISVQSEPGKGTLVTIRIPVSSQKNAKPAEKESKQ